MSKKTGLGNNPLDWIQNTKKQAQEKERPTSEVQESKSSEVQNIGTLELPKFKSFEVKLSILLRSDQLEFLEKLTREIMSKRDRENKKERVTKNTILRALVDVLMELDINKENIADESNLFNKIKAKFRSSEVKKT